MTITIIALCVLVYLTQRFTPDVLQQLAFAPSSGDEEPWRFLTAAFLHAGWLHLAVNMYALWIVGSVLEPALGRWRFVAMFLLSALGGSTAVLLLADPAGLSWVTSVVGASGAVFGLFAAIFLVLRRFGRDATQILVLFAINFAIGFIYPGISWQAHLGGAVVGALLGLAYVYAPKERRTTLSVAGTASMAMLLLVLVALRYATV
ncbi:rhomboid family intramembrane serine protease [Georgenia halophila]|uniref:rhomboid family intramembrane serine protease n=1 Tax=Georgenia halophila TaxID=620889 RepID=UPI0031E5B46C